MMKVQYVHIQPHQYNRSLKGTIAVETPTKEFLEKMFLTHSNVTLFKVGVSFLSPKDSFIKVVGRNVANKKLEYIKCELLEIQQDGTKHLYYFSAEVPHMRSTVKVDFQLTTVAESDNVRLIFGMLRTV